MCVFDMYECLTCVRVFVYMFIQGSTKSSTAEGIPEKTDSKDDNLVFVAGATGKVGSRTVRYIFIFQF